MKTNIDFINADTRKSFLAMSLPMMAAMFLNLAYNLVDSIWVGNLLGEAAMAALTSSMPIVLLLTSVAMGATNSMSILISRAIGAKERVDGWLISSFVLMLGFSLVVTAAAELCLPVFLRLLNTPEEIWEMAFAYISIYLLGYPAVCLYLYFTAILRSFGNTVLQAGALLLCVILNAVLDPLLIHYVGFHGAAVATVISQSIAMLIVIVYLFARRLIAFRPAAFNIHLFPEMMKLALPTIVQQSIPAISTSVLTAIVSGFGITAIAGYGIAGKLETILLYPAMSFNMVLTVIAGQCLGARRIDRARDYIACSFRYGGGLALLLAIFVAAASRPLSAAFVNTPEVAAIVAGYFLIIGIGYVFNTMTNCLLGVINGLSWPTLGMLLMIFYYLMVRLPLAFVLSNSSLGLYGVWLAVLVSHMVAFVSAGIVWRRCATHVRQQCSVV